MDSKTILSLYNGEYTFIERPTSKNKKYTDNLSKCIAIEEKLEKLVDEETFSLIEKALEYHSIMNSIEIEDSFVGGFSLAISLVLEALSEK